MGKGRLASSRSGEMLLWQGKVGILGRQGKAMGSVRLLG